MSRDKDYLKYYVHYAYEKLGWSFTKLANKRPIIKEWEKQPKPTTAQLTGWINEGNLGLRCGEPSGVLVIDVDIDKGADPKILKKMPKTVTVRRGPNYHFYFNMPLGIGSGNTTGYLADYVDSKGDGGQVVFGGSFHEESKQFYTFPTSCSPSEIVIADLPEEFLKLLQDKHNGVVKEKKAEVAKEKAKEKQQLNPTPVVKSRKYALAALTAECKKVIEAAPGQGNHILNTAGFKMGQLIEGADLDEGDAIKQLLQASQHEGRRGYTESMNTIRSGIKAGRKEPRYIPTVEKIPMITERANAGRPLAQTDMGNAERLVIRYGDKFRYITDRGKWLWWTGKFWEVSEGAEVYRCAFQTIDQIREEIKVLEESTEEDNDDLIESLGKHRHKSQAVGRYDAMVRLAGKFEAITIKSSQLDKDDWLFNCDNGTLDLRTAELKKHSQGDLITKASYVAWDPEAKCPRWETFIDEITDTSEYLGMYLQQLAGYCMTGDISEEIFPIFFGFGANGKSKFVETVCTIMGPYAGRAAPDLVVAKNFTGHPTEIADLMGKRLVIASETDEAVALRLAFVKEMTGEAKLKGRFMTRDFMEFDRTHKTWMMCNHKPVIKEASLGIWRRIKLVPFEVTIPEEDQDKKLMEKFKKEIEGIMVWMVKGLQNWSAHGFANPVEIEEATAEYRKAENPLTDFIENRIIFQSDSFTTCRQLWEYYESWVEYEKIKYPLSRRRLFEILNAIKGVTRKKTYQNHGQDRGFQGIMLKLTEREKQNELF